MVNLDIKEESPPTSKYNFDDFLSKHHLTHNGSSVNDNSTVNTKVSSQLTLSSLPIDKTDANQQGATSTDVSLSGLLNGGSARVICSEQKKNGITNSLLSSLCNSDPLSMKFKDGSTCEVSGSLSDILSDISIGDYDAPLQKNLNRGVSPVFNVTLNDISIPEFCETAKHSSSVQDSNLKNTHLLSESTFNVDSNFSDILSSIHIDSEDPEVTNSSTKSSSLGSSERSGCLSDFSINWELCDGQLSDLNTASNSYSKCDDTLSLNTFSVSDCVGEDNCKLSIAELAKNNVLSNVDSEILSSKEKESGNNFKKLDEKIEVNFSFFDFPSDDVSSRNQSSCANGNDNNCAMGKDSHISRSKLDENEDMELCFFPDHTRYNVSNKRDIVKKTATVNLNDSSTENTISMQDLFNSVNNPVSNATFSKSDEDHVGIFELIKPVNTPSRSASTSESSNDEQNISMLDLFNLVNNSSRSTSVSESSSLLSDEVEKNKNSSSDYFTLDEDDDENISNIDLSMCLKTQDNVSCSSLLDTLQQKSLPSITSEIPTRKPMKTHEDDLKYSLPFTNFNIPQSSRANVKQSLFAKSVACRPKKNHTLMQKVANIKCELFSSVFNRPAPLKKSINTPKAAVIYSDECTISCAGRRIFGPSAACELQ